MKGITARLRGMNFAKFCREQFRPKRLWTLGTRRVSRFVTKREKETVADFVSHFCATCLKIQDLSGAAKLDRFVRTLVPDISLQVELRGP